MRDLFVAQRFVWSPGWPVCLALAILPLVSLACTGGTEEPRVLTEIATLGADPSSEPWPEGRFWLPEISAGGIGLLDADGDGDLDIYHVRCPPPGAPARAAPNHLYRQTRPGEFVLVGESGLEDPGYGNGLAIGDVDNDGDPDVYVANLGRDGLYLNDGAGGFRDVSKEWGVATDTRWSSCAAFFDADGDGDLDLFISRYLDASEERICRETHDAVRDYCGPKHFRPVPDSLYLNDGGRFVDVTDAVGIRGARPGFGVVCLDFTADGRPDIYVANDMQANQLWVRQPDGTYRDEAVERGIALSGSGQPQAGMGVAIGDVNQDGVLDLFITHLVNQTSTLYMSRGDDPDSGHADRSASSGLGAPTLGLTSWGCGFLDLELDGDLDLVVVNGRVARGVPHADARLGAFWNDYAEPGQVFLNDGGGQFRVVTEPEGGFSRCVESSRGLAFGDLDRDGDIDVVQSVIGDRVRVWRNDATRKGHWVAVRALEGSRDALGAIVRLRAGGVDRVAAVLSTSSFQSASEPMAHFGIGTSAQVEHVEVRWPDGSRERFEVPGVDRRVSVLKGKGRPAG